MSICVSRGRTPVLPSLFCLWCPCHMIKRRRQPEQGNTMGSFVPVAGTQEGCFEVLFCFVFEKNPTTSDFKATPWWTSCQCKKFSCYPFSFVLQRTLFFCQENDIKGGKKTIRGNVRGGGNNHALKSQAKCFQCLWKQGGGEGKISHKCSSSLIQPGIIPNAQHVHLQGGKKCTILSFHSLLLFSDFLHLYLKTWPTPQDSEGLLRRSLICILSAIYSIFLQIGWRMIGINSNISRFCLLGWTGGGSYSWSKNKLTNRRYANIVIAFLSPSKTVQTILIHWNNM